MIKVQVSGEEAKFCAGEVSMVLIRDESDR